MGAIFKCGQSLSAVMPVGIWGQILCAVVSLWGYGGNVCMWAIIHKGIYNMHL